MHNRKLVDFDSYRNQRNTKDNTQKVRCSEELQDAIETLIQRLRECDPLKQVNG